MATRITTELSDGSSAGIRLTVSDSSGAVVQASAIAAISWSLHGTNESVINGREDVTLTVANPALIVLTPDDTTVTGTARTETRVLTVTWLYNDTLLGDGATKRQEYLLTINNFLGV